MLAEIERREADEGAAGAEQEKQAHKSEDLGQVDVDQSFAGRPASVH